MWYFHGLNNVQFIRIHFGIICCLVCFLTQQLPLVGLENITTFFELSQLGMDVDTDTLFIHGAMVGKFD